MSTLTDSKFALHLDDDDPWPGLASYDEASKDYFHGRDRDTAELLRLIRLWPFVTLYGKSGLGKSSMLLAGLFPQLRAARFLPVHLRLDYTEKAGLPVLVQAAQRLQQEIDAAGASASPMEEGETLWAYLQRREWPIWTRDNYPLTPVLVFDQFEEVFSRGGSAAHVQGILDSLADLIGDRIPVGLADDHDAARRLNLKAQQYRVVLSFRSDFLAEFESWEKQANLPRRESLHLTAMSRERAIEAVSRAGRKVLAPGVDAEIVDFLLQREGGTVHGRGAEVEPVLLSLCCYQLNRRRQRPAQIDSALLHTVGEGILKGFYDEALKDVPARVSVFIEERLIQGNRFRSNYPLEEALASGALTQQELDHLTDSRLLRVDPQGDVPRVELIHDRLVGVVRDARDARLAREAAEERAREERAEEERRREEAVQLAEKERDRERLALAQREQKRVARWRNLLAGAVVLLVAAVGYIRFEAAADERARIDAQMRADTADAQKSILETQTNILSDSLQKLRSVLAQLTGRPPGYTEVLMAAAPPDRPSPSQPPATIPRPSIDPAPPRPPMTSPAPDRPTIMQSRPPRPTTSGSSPRREILTIDRWTLYSGGCLKGDIRVIGPLVVTVTAMESGYRIQAEFNGEGTGFKVRLTADTVVAAAAGSYQLRNSGEWMGGKDRSFRTNGTDVVTVDKLGKPVSVRLQSIRSVCS